VAHPEVETNLGAEGRRPESPRMTAFTTSSYPDFPADTEDVLDIPYTLDEALDLQIDEPAEVPA